MTESEDAVKRQVHKFQTIVEQFNTVILLDKCEAIVVAKEPHQM